MIVSVWMLLLMLVFFAVVLIKLRAYQKMMTHQIQANLQARQHIINTIGMERGRKLDPHADTDDHVGDKNVPNPFKAEGEEIDNTNPDN